MSLFRNCKTNITYAKGMAVVDRWGWRNNRKRKFHPSRKVEKELIVVD